MDILTRVPNFSLWITSLAHLIDNWKPPNVDLLALLQTLALGLASLARLTRDWILGAPRSRFPPYEPPRQEDSNTAAAIALFDSLRREIGSHIPLDKQNPDQHPQALPDPRARERQMADFAALLEQIDFRALPVLAARVAIEAGLASKYRGEPRVGEAIFGTFHVCFPLEFEVAAAAAASRDGPGPRPRRHRWIVKFPVDGVRGIWDEAGARALESEVQTLRLLGRELGGSGCGARGARLRVPRVYCWSAGLGSEVAAPFVMMQHVEGRSLRDVWFTEWEGRWWTQEAEACRLGVLRRVAAAMAELGRFEFDAAGAPAYRDDGSLRAAVAPLRYLDVYAMLDRWLLDGGCSRRPVYKEAGPFYEEELFWTARLDRHFVGEQSDFGGKKALKCYLNWFWEAGEVLGIPFSDEDGEQKETVGDDDGDDDDEEEDEDAGETSRGKRGKRKKFVLAHPDLSLHNIIVDEKDNLYFIGWDGVAAVPRSVGNEALPLWLVRDWNPFLYSWREADHWWRYIDSPWDVKVPDENKFENLPWKLQGWREFYAKCMKEEKQRLKEKRNLDAAEQERQREKDEPPKASHQTAVEHQRKIGDASDERRGRPRYRYGEEPDALSVRPQAKASTSRYDNAPTKPTPSKPTKPKKRASSPARMDRTRLSALGLSLLTAANDARSRPMILQEIYHRSLGAGAGSAWHNFELARLRHEGGWEREAVPRPMVVGDRGHFYGMLLDCAGVPRGGRPLAAKGGFGELGVGS